MDESDSESVLLVVAGRDMVAVGASSGCAAIQAGSLREDGPGTAAGRSTMGERGASRRVSFGAALVGCCSAVGFGVNWIVWLGGGVAGIVAVELALAGAAVELEIVVVAGLVISANGFFFNPLPKAFRFLAIGF